MTIKQRDLFNNIGKPRIAQLESIYDLTKEDIKALKQRDLDMLSDYDNWEHHKDRQLLIDIINEWCETYRCYSLHY